MAIRWSQIQNIETTEQEINLLEGLVANAAQLNVLATFTGTSIDLNNTIGLGATVSDHLSKDIAHAHQILPGSIDGLALADGTIPQSKLAFDIATQVELDTLQNLHNNLTADHQALQSQVDTLAAIVIPGQGQDIAAAVAEAVAHINDTVDAHDASAISYGENQSGYYFPIADTLAGSATVSVGVAKARFFRPTDGARLQSNVAPVFNTTVLSVNYDTGVITLAAAPTSNYNVADQFRIWNLSEDTVQEGLDRSLKNHTDKFTGRLTMDQPYNHHISFTSEAKIKSANGFDFRSSTDVTIFHIDDLGNSLSNTHSLKDYVSGFEGLITKEPLTADRTWMFPDKDGYIGIGDLTFWDLLRVTANKTTGELTVAPGVLEDEYGQKVRAWINMAKGSDFAGATLDLADQIDTDGKLAGLGSNYLAFIVYLTYNDELFFWYSAAAGTTEQDAIDAIPPYLPTAYMKLGLVTVKGDGAGGILPATIHLVEDMRPIVSQGMSNAHYDESIQFPSVLNAGTLVSLPNNTRAGGKQQGYVVGSAELEVYVNDTFRERGRDYVEVTGSTPGQIAFNYDLPANSVVRFRINWGAATNIGGGSGSGGGAGNLQDAYLGGPNIFTLPGVPVTIAAGTGNALIVSGDASISGFTSSMKGLEFVDQASEPGGAGINKLYADADGDLIFKRNFNNTTYNITQSLDASSSQQGRNYTNNTGATIPAYRAVALHPTVPGQIIPADVSSNTASAFVIGITTAAINNGASGKVVWSGYVPLAGAAFTHGNVLMASAAGPGIIASQTTLTLAPGNMAVEIGIVDGTGVLVNINRKGQV